VNWWEHPERDEKWKDEIIRDIGPARFAQEYSCVGFRSYINIKDKESGAIEKIAIGDFFERI
jgi:hypothetical protein